MTTTTTTPNTPLATDWLPPSIPLLPLYLLPSLSPFSPVSTLSLSYTCHLNSLLPELNSSFPNNEPRPRNFYNYRQLNSPYMMPLEIFQNLFHAIYNMLVCSSSSHDVPLPHQRAYPDMRATPSLRRPLDDLSKDVVRQFLNPLNLSHMLSMSSSMRREYRVKLQDSADCMLPSYCHTLPTGQETGSYLALDVGGSTFRVALVELNGRSQGQHGLRIRRMTSATIDNTVRRLPSTQFFDWMAKRIQTMLADEPEVVKDTEGSIPIGLAWSFPIEQTSSRGGKVKGMGKGFNCHEDTVGKDLGDLIIEACSRQGLRVRVDAIINDSSATLLSQAYLEPSTSMGLILGTGTNAAVHLPVSCIGAAKFGVREPSWHARAEKVITNTELSMFGKGILPETRWDVTLNRNHPIPDFQPLEYMTTGRYLGEILRLIIVEAVETTELFGGIMPESISEPYSLDTLILARLEEDNSSTLSSSAFMLQKTLQLSLTPSKQEMLFLRSAAAAISHRASAYLAVAIHALWRLQKETEINPTTPCGTPKTSIACNGSVIVKYPGLRERCQDYIAQMIAGGSGLNGAFPVERVTLQPTDEAAILGAAVAVAVGDGE